MSFAFNFSGDDIEADQTESSVQGGQSDANDVGGPVAPSVPVQEHSLNEWVGTDIHPSDCIPCSIVVRLYNSIAYLKSSFILRLTKFSS